MCLLQDEYLIRRQPIEAEPRGPRRANLSQARITSKIISAASVELPSIANMSGLTRAASRRPFDTASGTTPTIVSGAGIWQPAYESLSQTISRSPLSGSVQRGTCFRTAFPSSGSRSPRAAARDGSAEVNRLLTQDEVMTEIVKPMTEAFHAGLPAVYDEARVYFAKGGKVYRTHYFGMAIELRPKDIPPKA